MNGRSKTLIAFIAICVIVFALMSTGCTPKWVVTNNETGYMYTAEGYTEYLGTKYTLEKNRKLYRQIRKLEEREQ